MQMELDDLFMVLGDLEKAKKDKLKEGLKELGEEVGMRTRMMRSGWGMCSGVGCEAGRGGGR